MKHSAPETITPLFASSSGPVASRCVGLGDPGSGPATAAFMNQSDARGLHFDGATYDPQHDHARLNGLLARVFRVMADGRWRTLAEIQAVTGGTEASVSARLRDFRKPRFGGHQVERRRRGDAAAGVHEYRLTADNTGAP